ncbi:MAG: nucleoside deaminase [Candidatus Dormibacteraceae bacterium]
MKPSISDERAEELIKLCQEEVEVAIKEGNVPIACVITDLSGNLLLSTHNTQNTDSDPTAHAEMNALRLLGKQKGTLHLDGYVVFGNAEPCSMCVSACIKAHIYGFYYGAPAEISMDPWLPITKMAKFSKNPLIVHGPILGEKCAAQIAFGRRSIASLNTQNCPSARSAVLLPHDHSGISGLPLGDEGEAG